MTETFKKFKNGFLIFLKDYNSHLTTEQKRVLLKAASMTTGLEKEAYINKLIADLGITPEEAAAQMFIKHTMKGSYMSKGQWFEDGQRFGMYIYPLPGQYDSASLKSIVKYFNPHGENITVGSHKLVFTTDKGVELEYPVTVLW